MTEQFRRSVQHRVVLAEVAGPSGRGEEKAERYAHLLPSGVVAVLDRVAVRIHVLALIEKLTARKREERHPPGLRPGMFPAHAVEQRRGRQGAVLDKSVDTLFMGERR